MRDDEFVGPWFGEFYYVLGSSPALLTLLRNFAPEKKRLREKIPVAIFTA